jgi:hypothetical protein
MEMYRLIHPQTEADDIICQQFLPKEGADGKIFEEKLFRILV